MFFSTDRGFLHDFLRKVSGRRSVFFYSVSTRSNSAFAASTASLLPNAAERKSLCSVDAAALKAEAADLSVRMEKGVRLAFGSKEAVEAAKALFDRVETL